MPRRTAAGSCGLVVPTTTGPFHTNAALAAALVVLSACTGEPRPPASVPPPPAKVAPEQPEPKPGLNHHQLRKVMKGKADPAVSGCYTIAYSGKEGGTGTLVVDFSVNPDGSVDSASIKDSTLGDPTLEECVRKVYESLSFPTAPGATDASRPYNFKNSQDMTDTAVRQE